MFIFAIRDLKANSYDALGAMPTAGLAVRGFVEALAQKGPLTQYPEDYSLCELGTFDQATGVITGHPMPKVLMTAVEGLEIRQRLDARQLRFPGGPVPVGEEVRS